MTPNDRTEVREMIHSTLEGWEKATVARESMTLIALEKIEGHLRKINGSIASHDKIINANLPHNISLCPQAPVIEEIRDTIIKSSTKEKTLQEIKADKRLEWAKWIQTGMFIIGAVALIYTAYNTHKNNKMSGQIESKVESLGEPVVISPRGNAVVLPEGYELKMWGKDTTK